MATAEIEIAAPPERVWQVLADGDRYAEWVIGTQRVRAVDDGWPAAGTRLYHTSGAGPANVDDTTEVLEAEEPARLVLLANLGAVGAVRVVLQLEREGSGTLVSMKEEPARGPVASLPARVASDVALAVRNTFSLSRLKDLAES
jgi:uncharacterized protein YndB with AHSA1/START domain